MTPATNAGGDGGFLSVPREWHALAAGYGAGLTAGFLMGTEYEAVGFLAIAAVAATALGIQTAAEVGGRIGDAVRREGWYALGGIPAGLVSAVIILAALGGL